MTASVALPVVSSGSAGVPSREQQNRAVALRLVKAKVPILAAGGNKRPFVKGWNERDDAMTKERRAEHRKEALDKHGREPVHIGCTINPNVVDRLWAHDAAAVPGIVCEHAGLIVVDCDRKHVPDGPEQVRAYFEAHGVDLSDVPQVRSGSTGMHYYFANPDRISSGAIPRFDVDIKGVGGYVVAPGSIRSDGKTYVPVEGTPDLLVAMRAETIPPLPACIRTLIAERREQKDNDAEIQGLIVDLQQGEPDDLDQSYARFDLDALRAKDVEFSAILDSPSPDHSANRFTVAKCLRREYPNLTVHHYARFLDDYDGAGSFTDASRPVQGEYDDRAMAREFSNAAGSRPINMGEIFGDLSITAAWSDLQFAWIIGCGEAEAHDLFTQRVQDDETDADKRALALADAAKFRDGDAKAGDRLMALYMPAVQVEKTKAEKPKKGLHFHTGFDLTERAFEPPVFLIDDLIEVATVFVLYGHPGAGKSALILDMLAHVSEGLPWAGRATRKTPTLYVSSEGPAGTPRRIRAWRSKHHPAALKDLHVSAQVVDLFRTNADGSNDAAAAIIAAARSIGAGCIVIDTLRQTLVGGDENSASDVGLYMARIATIRAATKAAVGVVHHTGKDKTRGASGSGALIANVDVELIADKAKPEHHHGTLRAGKMRDGYLARPITYDLQSVEVGRDSEKTYTALMAHAREPGEALALAVEEEPPAEMPAAEELSDRERLMLHAAEAACAETGSASVAEIDDAYVAALKAEGGARRGASPRTARVLRSALVEAGYLETVGSTDKTRYRLCETRLQIAA